MSLAEQVVAFPLVGGVDESTPSRLCARLLTMSNCRQMKSGSLEKRYGTNCVGAYNARLGGGTPPTAELLAAYGTELVRIGSGHVDTCRAVGSTDSIYKGRASEALVYRQTLTSGESYIGDCEVGYGNGLTVYVCRSNIGALLAGDASILYFVIDSDGAVVVPRTVLDSATSTNIGTPHVTIIGTSAVFTWGTTAGIVGRTLDLATLTLGAQTTLIASTYTHATAALASTLAIIYDDGAGIKMGTWTTALAVSVAASTISADTGVTTLAVEAATGGGGAIYYGYAYDNAGTLTVKAGSRNRTTLAATLAIATIFTSGTAGYIRALGIAVPNTGSTVWYSWNRYTGLYVTAQVDWVSMTTLGVLGTVRFTDSMTLLSKPAYIDGLIYALAANVHSTHGTMFLVHLQDGTTPATSLGMRIVAVIAPRQVSSAVEAAVFNTGTVASIVPTLTGRYAVGCVVGGAIPDSSVACLLDVRIGSTKPSAVEVGGLLVCSGGVVTAYDGGSVAELGMPWEPDFAGISASAVTGGSVAAGTYYYLVTYEWRFANGAVVRSIPSYPEAFDGTAAIGSQGLVSVTTAGGNLTGRVVVPYLNLTNKQAFTGKVNAISLVLYRTTLGGSTFYRASAVQLAAGSFNVVGSTAGVSIDDALSDADLRTRPVLYTGGGYLPSEIPPSSGHVAVIQNRVWLSSTDDDTIWVSHEIVDGEAPAFSGTVTIAPFEGGRVVGVAGLDEKKIIFKAGSLYYLTGDGPSATGSNGSFSNPIRIPSDVGCTDVRSIVSTPIGVMFQSQNGLALLSRNLEVSLVGKAVEDTLGANAIVAASLVPDQDLVRFAVASPSTSTTLEYDMFHGGAWGANTYRSPGGAGTETIVAATYCRGSWFYASSAGLIFQEVKTQWLDTKSGSTSLYVTQSARLRYLSLGDLQGFARCWYVSVLGTKRASHDLTVKLYVDDQASTVQTTLFTAAAINAWSRYQAQVHVAQQECEAISVEVFDATPSDATLGTGQGFALLGVSAEVGLDKPLRRVPAAQTG